MKPFILNVDIEKLETGRGIVLSPQDRALLERLKTTGLTGRAEIRRAISAIRGAEARLYRRSVNLNCFKNAGAGMKQIIKKDGRLLNDDKIGAVEIFGRGELLTEFLSNQKLTVPNGVIIPVKHKLQDGITLTEFRAGADLLPPFKPKTE